MRVLVVEDYDPLRVALKKALTEAGYAVVTEPDGAAALELLSRIALNQAE